MIMRLLVNAGIALFVHDIAALAQCSGDKLYWSIPGAIMRANLDGTSPETIVDSRTIVLGTPSIAVDPVEKKLYWTNYWGLYRSDLGGNGVESLGSASAAELAVDPVGRKLYWLDRATSNQIYRSNLNGTEREKILDWFEGFPQRSSIVGLAIGTADRRLYLGQTRLDFSRPTYEPPWRAAILSVNLDGSGLQVLKTAIRDTEGRDIDFRLNRIAAGRSVYWTGLAQLSADLTWLRFKYGTIWRLPPGGGPEELLRSYETSFITGTVGPNSHADSIAVYEAKDLLYFGNDHGLNDQALRGGLYGVDLRGGGERRIHHTPLNKWGSSIVPVKGTCTTSNLKITRVDAVQAPFTPEGKTPVVVAGKPTAFFVEIQTDCWESLPEDDPIEVTLEVNPMPREREVLAVPIYKSQFVARLGVHYAVAVFGRSSGYIFDPAVAASATSGVIEATVNANRAITECDYTDNNSKDVSFKLATTRPLRILAVRVESDNPGAVYQRSGVWGNPSHTAEENKKRLERFYPVHEVQLKNETTETYKPVIGTSTTADLSSDLQTLEDERKLRSPEADFIIAMVPVCYFAHHLRLGKCDPENTDEPRGRWDSTHPKVIRVREDARATAAHEIGHAFGIALPPNEEYREDNDPRGPPYPGNPASGYSFDLGDGLQAECFGDETWCQQPDAPAQRPAFTSGPARLCMMGKWGPEKWIEYDHYAWIAERWRCLDQICPEPIRSEDARW